MAHQRAFSPLDRRLSPYRPILINYDYCTAGA
jgi:hypothetical protein